MSEAKRRWTWSPWAAKEHGHAVLGFTGSELNQAKELNRRLYEYLPPVDIVMDLTTVALGYGLEALFTIDERARHAALMGNTDSSSRQSPRRPMPGRPARHGRDG